MERRSPDPNHVIRAGEGLELWPIVAGDAAELFTEVDRNRVRLREWLPWVGDSYSLADAQEFALKCERENAERVALTTVIRFDRRLCGAIGLHRIDPSHRSTSIGYWLAGAFEGQGVMTRACEAMVTHGFNEYGLHRLEIRCATGNHRSGAIPLRLGFREEGILREAEWLYDHWVDLRVFAMLEQDWRK